MNETKTPSMSYFRDDVLGMQGYKSGEQPQGGKFIKLNTNENPYRCSDAVVQAIISTAQAGLQRYPDASALAFRTGAAEALDVEPDWILCGNGSDEILTILTRAFVGPDQVVRWPYPTYVLYPVLTEIQGGDRESIPFNPDWSLADEFFVNSRDVRLIFLANPNSPSGTLIPADEIRRLAESVSCPIVVDEAYADFSGTSCIDLVRENEKILVARTLSKSHALAGLRFGYLVAQPHLIEQLNKIKDSYNCDALSIAGATAAIADQVWLETTVARIVQTRQSLEKDLADLGFQVTPSQANFVWCQHAQEDSQKIYEQLKRNQILIRYMNYPDWGDGIRITVGTPDQIDALLTILKSIV